MCVISSVLCAVYIVLYVHLFVSYRLCVMDVLCMCNVYMCCVGKVAENL